MQSHSPAGIDESDQQGHGHSKSSILAIFLPKHTQFLLCEANKTLACEHSCVVTLSPFNMVLQAPSHHDPGATLGISLQSC